MESLRYLEEYYTRFDEHGRLETRHGQVEFVTTMHYIARYLRPGMRVLEIGAGTGRYSHALARRGYRVDAVELIGRNVEVFRSLTQPEEQISVVQGNATALTGFADETYDLTLLLGPLYHLYTREEKRQALEEALRVTRRGGVMMAAYCMAEPAILTHGFIRGQVRRLMDAGMLDPVTFRTHTKPDELFELVRTEDIAALREGLDAEALHLVATDGYACHMRDALAAMDEEDFAVYLRYHLATCERMDLMGYSNHVLDILRRREAGACTACADMVR